MTTLQIRRSTKMIAIIAAVVVFGAVIPASAEDTCHHCGDCGHHEYKLCLVRVCEEVELPQYQCDTLTVFCPSRAPVEHRMQRCDNFMRLDKCGMDPMPVVDCPTCQTGNCGCASSASSGCETVICHPPTWSGRLYYRRSNCTKESCETHYGACPNGEHVCAQISRPNGETCKITVPVMRWVRVPVCESCCGHGHGGGH